jgi:hypothetical protein
MATASSAEDTPHRRPWSSRCARPVSADRTSVVDGPVVEIDVMLDPEKLRRVAVD